MNTELRYSKELVQLRRSKVLELMAQSIPQSAIAEQLGVSTSTVSLDVQYLRETARTNIQNHIEEKIPMQYYECETGLKLLLRKVHELINKSTRPQDQIHAMALAADIYSKLMDLSTNGSILTSTLKWLEEKKKIELTKEEQNQVDEVLECEGEEPGMTDCERIEREQDQEQEQDQDQEKELSEE